MTRDEILLMARNAEMGFDFTAPSVLSELTRFADLVAAKEREACALICEKEAARALANWHSDLQSNKAFWNGGENLAASCAELIRASNRPRAELDRRQCNEKALEVHGTVYFKDNHQYRSQLRFPIADGAYELVKIESLAITDPLFNVKAETFVFGDVPRSPTATGEAA